MKVLVLGAGVIGICSAYFLAKQGHDVTVVDRQNGSSLETSYANAGQISYSYCSPWANPKAPMQAIKWILSKNSPFVINPNIEIDKIKFLFNILSNCSQKKYQINKDRMLRISSYSKICFKEIENDIDIEYEQRKKGFLQILRKEKQFLDAQKDAKMLNKFGINYKILNIKECIAVEPALENTKDKIFAGIRFEQDATGNCYKFSQELQKKCIALGVKFEFNINIKKLCKNNNKIEYVKTNKGDLNADNFIVSMGSYSKQILNYIGIKIPIYPIKGYSITVPIIKANKAPQSTIMDETYKVAITRLGNTIRAAGTAELNAYNLSLREKSRNIVRHCVKDLFPDAADMKEDNFWTGLRPSTPDGTPIIGKTPIKNLFINSGHGTLGWTMSAGSGKLITDIICKNKTDISLDGLDMYRYL